MEPKTLTRQNGYAIRAIREKDGQSVEGLAKVIGISTSYMRSVENESRSIGAAAISRVAAALGVPTVAIRNRAVPEDTA